MSSGARRRSRRRNVVVASAVVLVLAAGGTAWGLSASSGPHYRAATVARSTVQQTLSVTGTVSPVSSADETFQVAGTVAKVNVKTGQKVHAGDVLAHLDRSSLRNQLQSAQSTLASARARMTSDQDGQSSEASKGSTSALLASQPTPVGTSAGGNGTGPASGNGSNGGNGSGSGTDNISRLQADVRAAQQATDGALGAASAALKAADAACAAETTSASSTPDPEATASPDPQPSTPSSTDCTAAGAALLTQQQQVSRAEQQLADAETALTQAVTAMLRSAKNGSPSASPSGQSIPSRATGDSTVTAADIALDQANIDQALAAVAADKADLAEATLRSSIDGRVAAVNVSRGDAVSASSDTAAVTVIGSQQDQTTVDLSATEIRQVKVGMTAHVVIDGSAKSLTGRVVDIDSAGTESSTGSVSYPVTISLPAGTQAVSGAAASVTVVVAAVDDVLCVPTSAVHYNGTTAYVELLRDGKLSRHTVKVGAVGAALTQIDSGLSAGQQVVLADLDEAVPSSSTTQTRGGFGGFGGFAGGGGGFVRRFTGRGGGALPAIPSGASLG